MRPLNRTLPSVAAALLAAATPVALHAQARATAVQGLQLSAYAGLAGSWTGLDAYGTDAPMGKNLDFTAGVDLGFRPRYGLFPSIEVRGYYPVGNGQVDSQESVMGGLKLGTHPHHGVRFYGDVLFGRGQITYNNGYPNPAGTFLYLQTPSNVLSFGAGADIPVTEHFGVKLDAQGQRWSTPVTLTGHTDAVPITAAVVYRFDFNHHYRRR